MISETSLTTFSIREVVGDKETQSAHLAETRHASQSSEDHGGEIERNF